MSCKVHSVQSTPAAGPISSADRLLLEQIRRGDADAGHRFIQDYYPGVYRYLLVLTGSRDSAEDLTQETFLQAWRRLDTFEGRSALRTWLHHIAHREFLQALRSRRLQISLEEAGELPEAHPTPVTETAELRAILGKLPMEQRHIVMLHYLEGHEYEEIAQILGIPSSRVKHRLSEARARLRQELGERDLAYLNEPSAPMRQWAWLPLDQMFALETRLTRGGVRRQALGVGSEGRAPNAQRLTPDAWSEASEEKSMERREFLRQAAVGAAGLMLTEPEKEIVDPRLTQKVTCAYKATALSDLCEKLQADTGVHLAAGNSVADEKVTLFCEKLPLREVMRQLSRPFGYTWLRSGQALGVGRQVLGESPAGPNAQRLTPNASYRYELVQDLRSQLLEEELRNRDRIAALLALENEIERYRPYLHLSPDEALARAKTAPAEKPLLEKLATGGWGPIQMYFRLSNQERAALRAGQTLTFSEVPQPGEQSLAPELARAVFQSFRDWRVRSVGDLLGFDRADRAGPGKLLPLTEVPELRASITLTMPQRELGELTLDGSSRLFFLNGSGGFTPDKGPYASGRSPAALKPDNRAVNLRLAGDPALGHRVTIHPHSSCQPALISPRGQERSDPPAERAPGGEVPSEPMVTTADVLEALHQATGMPLVADYYTRLYKSPAVSVRELVLFEALNQLADTLRLRWRKEEEWLQFRSASYYDDRIKEVPNRLLSRWSAARRHGARDQDGGGLRLDDLLEIAQLPDAQLDAAEMAEGARDCWDLKEWDIARSTRLRPHLRYLATFTPEQRRMAMSDAGLPFPRMTLAQQQQFIAFAIPSQNAPPRWLEELADAVLRVEYTQPGWFRWGSPDEWNFGRWVARRDSQRERILRPSVQERTREGALQALRRADPQIREAVLQTMRRSDPRLQAAPPDEETQIFPTRLSLAVVYIPGGAPAPYIHVVTSDHNMFQPGEP
jgi:RNA polymerase sigma-70 factor (ECF subfamily)